MEGQSVLLRLVKAILNRRWLLYLVIIINIAGFTYGIYYYWNHLLATPWYLLPFVPDCPLYAGMAALCLAVYAAGRRPAWLFFLTSVGLVKYGIWTVTVILVGSHMFLSGPLMTTYLGLAVSHVFLALEVLLFIPLIKSLRWRDVIPTVAIMYLWDYSDYFWGAYPGMPADIVPFMATFTFALTTAIIFLIYFSWRRWGKSMSRLAPRQ